MDYYNVQLTLAQPQVQHFEAILEQGGALSLSFMDAQDQPIYEPRPGDIWDVVIMLGLFDDKQKAYEMVEQLTHDHTQGLLAIDIKPLADQAWERVWLKHFKPLFCGNQLWVCPTSEPVSDPSAINLMLDPGLAFGTGTHPTTWQCLHWLSQQVLDGKCVIDYGCGSGILAIAAVLLGAKRADCIDIEEQAMVATRYNAQKNNLTEQQVVTLGMDVEQLVPADILLANILAEPLIELKETLISKVKPGGYLVMSGLLDSQVDQIVATYTGIDFDIQSKDGWAMLAAHLTNTWSLSQTDREDE